MQEQNGNIYEINHLDQILKWGLDPIPLDRKKPKHNQWPKRKYTREELDAHHGNYGIRLRSDQIVIDVDPRNFPEGDDTLARLVEDFDLDLDSAPKVETGGGGWHYYFTKPKGPQIVSKLPGYPGIEFKSKGSQVVAPGSIHDKTGKEYVWDDVFDLGLDEAPRLPKTLGRALTKRSTAKAGEPGEYTPEQIEAMLQSMDPAQFNSNASWEPLMMAVHQASNGEAREEFIAWSTSDPTYSNDGEKIGARWDSLSVSKKGAKRGGGTLRQLVIRYGDQETIPRTSAAAEDFAGELLDDEVLDDDPEHSSLGVLDRGLQVTRTGK
ncbi:MAG: bifunctional DNA primase/polymerase, partial [Pseudomonadota bacterium]